MLVVIDHDVVPAVGAPFEVTGKGRVLETQRLERLRHRADIHRSAQSQRDPDEVLGLGEELLAGRQLTDR
jgi:hypothetical protein